MAIVKNCRLLCAKYRKNIKSLLRNYNRVLNVKKPNSKERLLLFLTRRLLILFVLQSGFIGMIHFAFLSLGHGDEKSG